MARKYNKQDEAMSRQWWKTHGEMNASSMAGIADMPTELMVQALFERFFDVVGGADALGKLVNTLETRTDEDDIGLMMLAVGKDHVKCCEIVVDIFTRLKSLILIEPNDVPDGFEVYREFSQRQVLEKALETALTNERYEDAKVIKKQIKELDRD